MGILQDFLNNAASIDTAVPITALDKQIIREIQDLVSKGDIESPGSAYEARNEEQRLSSSGASAGTFDITVGIHINGFDYQIPITDLAYDITGGELQDEVNTALNAVFGADYTDDDLAVSDSGDVSVNTTVFDYEGGSLIGIAHPICTIDGSGLTDGGNEAFTRFTKGQTTRRGWAILDALSIVGFSAVPDQGPAGTIPTLTRVDIPRNISQATIEAIVTEIASFDRIPGLEDELLNTIFPGRVA